MVDKDVNVKVKVDTSELIASDKKATETEKKIKDTVKKSQTEMDITWLKAVTTVQQMSSLIQQSVGIFGRNLSSVAKASISFVTQGISTIAPLLVAQELSGWQAIQATLGLFALGQAGIQLGILVQEEKRLSSSFEIETINTINPESWYE